MKLKVGCVRLMICAAIYEYTRVLAELCISLYVFITCIKNNMVYFRFRFRDAARNDVLDRFVRQTFPLPNRTLY